MILYKFLTQAKAHKNYQGEDMPAIDNISFVVAETIHEAKLLLESNWRKMGFKRIDNPEITFLGLITQETERVFNECELTKPMILL